MLCCWLLGWGDIEEGEGSDWSRVLELQGKKLHISALPPTWFPDMPQEEEGAIKKKKEEQEALSKPHFLLRWVVLCAGSLMIFCSYYAYDIPSAIKPQLNEYFGRPSNFEFQFNLLYTLYAAPNVPLMTDHL